MNRIQLYSSTVEDFIEWIALFEANGYVIGNTYKYHCFILIDRHEKYFTSRPTYTDGIKYVTLSEEVRSALVLLPTFELKEEFLVTDESFSL